MAPPQIRRGTVRFVDTSTHLSDEQIEAYVFGRLVPADVGAIEDHLLVCVPRRDRVDAERRTNFVTTEALLHWRKTARARALIVHRASERE